MPADLTNPFGPSCCDGGDCTTSGRSALPCGCDPGANYIATSCWLHQTAAAPSSIAHFASGLQLDDDEDDLPASEATPREPSAIPELS